LNLEIEDAGITDVLMNGIMTVSIMNGTIVDSTTVSIMNGTIVDLVIALKTMDDLRTIITMDLRTIITMDLRTITTMDLRTITTMDLRTITTTEETTGDIK
jgi:hypothetical protein